MMKDRCCTVSRYEDTMRCTVSCYEDKPRFYCEPLIGQNEVVLCAAMRTEFMLH